MSTHVVQDDIWDDFSDDMNHAQKILAQANILKSQAEAVQYNAGRRLLRKMKISGSIQSVNMNTHEIEVQDAHSVPQESLS
mgnify:CR=1 FL=1